MCFSCESQHKEVAFFEFGEISHQHNHYCGSDANHKEVCSCSANSDEHLRNSQISFYSLKLLFSKKLNNDTVQNVIKFISNFNFFTIIFNHNNIQTNSFYTSIKAPPLINTQFLSSLDFCSVFSIFRL